MKRLFTLIFLATSKIYSLDYSLVDLATQPHEWSENSSILNDRGQVVFITENDYSLENIYFYDKNNGTTHIDRADYYFGVVDLNNNGDFIVELADEDLGNSFDLYSQSFEKTEFKHNASAQTTLLPSFINNQGQVMGLKIDIVKEEMREAIFLFDHKKGLKSYSLPKDCFLKRIVCFTQNGEALIELYRDIYSEWHRYNAPYFDPESTYAIFSKEKGVQFLGDFGLLDELSKKFPEKRRYELQDLKMNENGMISGLIAEITDLYEDIAMPFVYHPKHGLKLFIEKQKDGSEHFFVGVDEESFQHHLNNKNELFFAGYKVIVKEGQRPREVSAPAFTWSFEKGYNFLPKISPKLSKEEAEEKTPVYTKYYSFNDDGLAVGSYCTELNLRDVEGCFLTDTKTHETTYIDLGELEFKEVAQVKMNARGQFLIHARDHQKFYHLLLVDLPM